MTKKKHIAVGYCRVSTAGQALHGASLPDQQEAIETYCTAHGIELVEVVKDAGISGKKWATRRGIQRVKKMVEHGEADLIVVKSMSRLGRSTRELLNIMAELEQAGASLVLLRENLNTSTVAGRLMRTVLAAIAEFEVDLIVERTTDGKARRRREGKAVAVQHVYGYDYHNRETRRVNESSAIYTVNETEAAIVRQVVAWLHAGLPLNQIIVKLKEQRVKTKRGNSHWSTATIAGLLRNPILYGLVADNRFTAEKTTTKDGRPVVKRRLRPRAEWREITRLPEAILTEDEWNVIQPMVGDRNKSRNVAADDPFILRDLVFCSDCFTRDDEGFHYTKMVPSRGTPRRRYYTCYWRKNAKKAVHRGRRACTMPNVPAEELEQVLMDYATKAVLTPRILVDRLLTDKAAKAERTRLARDVKRIDGEIAKIDKQQKRAVAVLMDPSIPTRLRDDAIGELEHDRSVLLSERDSLQRKLAGVEQSISQRAALIAGIDGLKKMKGVTKKVLGDLTNDEKKRLVRAAMTGLRLEVYSVSKDGAWGMGDVFTGSTDGMDDVKAIHEDFQGTVHPWPARTKKSGRGRPARPLPTDSVGWVPILTGGMDVAQVVIALSEFAETIRQRIYGKSKSTSTRHTGASCHERGS